MVNQYVHSLSQETDKMPCWIRRKERVTVENISWSISMKECCWTGKELNPRPPDHQSDVHPTEQLRPACYLCNKEHTSFFQCLFLPQFLPLPLILLLLLLSVDIRVCPGGGAVIPWRSWITLGHPWRTVRTGAVWCSHISETIQKKSVFLIRKV